MGWLAEDTPCSGREFERRMAVARARAEGAEEEQLRGGWKLGAEDFADWLAEKLSPGPGGRGTGRGTGGDGHGAAQRLVREALAAVRWREVDLALQPKGHPVKVEVARELRRAPSSRIPLVVWSAVMTPALSSSAR